MFCLAKQFPHGYLTTFYPLNGLKSVLLLHWQTLFMFKSSYSPWLCFSATVFLLSYGLPPPFLSWWVCKVHQPLTITLILYCSGMLSYAYCIHFQSRNSLHPSQAEYFIMHFITMHIIPASICNQGRAKLREWEQTKEDWESPTLYYRRKKHSLMFQPFFPLVEWVRHAFVL